MVLPRRGDLVFKKILLERINKAKILEKKNFNRQNTKPNSTLL